MSTHDTLLCTIRINYFHKNSYKIDVYVEPTFFAYLWYKFSHSLKNKWSKISKFNHMAKTPVTITRMKITKYVVVTSLRA